MQDPLESNFNLITTVFPVSKSVLGIVQAQSTIVNKSHPSHHNKNTHARAGQRPRLVLGDYNQKLTP